MVRSSPNYGRRPRVRGYCAYDWGKTFETSVTTAVFPAWFAYLFAEANGISTKILGSEWTADAMFSAAVMVGALLVAICAPSLGVIADRRMIKNLVAQNSYLGRFDFLCSTSIISIPRCFYRMDMGNNHGMVANVGLNGAGVFTMHYCYTWVMNLKWIRFQTKLLQQATLGEDYCLWFT